MSYFDPHFQPMCGELYTLSTNRGKVLEYAHVGGDMIEVAIVGDTLPTEGMVMDRCFGEYSFHVLRIDPSRHKVIGLLRVSSKL